MSDNVTVLPNGIRLVGELPTSYDSEKKMASELAQIDKDIQSIDQQIDHTRKCLADEQQKLEQEQQKRLQIQDQKKQALRNRQLLGQHLRIVYVQRKEAEAHEQEVFRQYSDTGDENRRQLKRLPPSNEQHRQEQRQSLIDEISAASQVWRDAKEALQQLINETNDAGRELIATKGEVYQLTSDLEVAEVAVREQEAVVDACQAKLDAYQAERQSLQSSREALELRRTRWSLAANDTTNPGLADLLRKFRPPDWYDKRYLSLDEKLQLKQAVQGDTQLLQVLELDQAQPSARLYVRYVGGGYEISSEDQSGIAHPHVSIRDCGHVDYARPAGAQHGFQNVRLRTVRYQSHSESNIRANRSESVA